MVAGFTKDTASTRIPGFPTILSKGLSPPYLPLLTPSSTYQQAVAGPLIPPDYQRTRREYRRDRLLKRPKPKGKRFLGKASLPFA